MLDNYLPILVFLFVAGGLAFVLVGLGFLLAVLVALPVGFLIGMSPLKRKAFDPFIQVLKPLSPLAWMPLALYTLKNSDVSGIFVIFICSAFLNSSFVAEVK